ncbi:hypothetical protein [Clostridium algidicarnis]|uniref:hypothetical protein n=1 Tax=Clostridium algidicarnis TaxID=37659 RepID=UPI001C0B2895|nr:hypothetical protein [Clostridium algidicarnis]MBU3194481.1 hypothetical protein [Clostridium algidicarnis]
MKATTVVMFVTSIFFIIFGIIVLSNKKFREKMISSTKNIRDKEGYIRFNAKYNIIIGSLGLIVAVVDNFISEGKITLVMFIGVMLGASLMQSMKVKKYL